MSSGTRDLFAGRAGERQQKPSAPDLLSAVTEEQRSSGRSRHDTTPEDLSYRGRVLDFDPAPRPLGGRCPPPSAWRSFESLYRSLESRENEALPLDFQTAYPSSLLCP
ncbi:hypothetical protein EYF80_035764 [Liparis tanakae]|uniref:Uncharacterized protein n=1 Tax=Liparis tanakae TaxID=230148 RepID=A0A4Z2GLD5_9TELE|nr:hypothetical protein EYF80_035764 [Liparis tanakae]